METKDVTGRCAGCKFLKITSDGRWQFTACTHEPYKGKWTREIELCPKMEALKDNTAWARR